MRGSKVRGTAAEWRGVWDSIVVRCRNMGGPQYIKAANLINLGCFWDPQIPRADPLARIL
eukprot:749322-Pyramimonas_sp.AAC.1